MDTREYVRNGRHVPVHANGGVEPPEHLRQRLAAGLIQSLPLIDRATSALSRRAGLHGADAEDFASWVRLRLIEDDYAILRKFRGESSLQTYIAVVTTMLLREYRVRSRGRWRPSARARRLGTTAVRLETLVYRDGQSLDCATQILRSAEAAELSDREVAELFRQLPRRQPPRPVVIAALPDDAPDPDTADATVLNDEAVAWARVAEDGLVRALACLSDEDQLIVRMHFWESLSIADIARALRLPQKPLYRRLERALVVLRRRLEISGVTRRHAQLLLEVRAA